MKGKYITLNIQLACARKENSPKEDIRQQIASTIEERKRILKSLEMYTQTAAIVNVILTQNVAA